MYFDSHLHSEGLGFSELKKMGESGIKEICSLSFYPIKPRYPQTMIDAFRKLTEFETVRCEAAGVRMYPAVGIHPRCIPPEYHTTLNYLEDGEWVVFGEIGLETGSEEEVDVLEAQLRLAERLDLPCIIHTPRGNKKEMTEKTLEILEKINFPNELAVVDHVNFDTIDMVFDSGYWVGLTVQPGKLSVEDVVKIISEYEVERFMLNSDAGYSDSEFTMVAKAAERIAHAIGKSEAKMVARKNARTFLRV